MTPNDLDPCAHEDQFVVLVWPIQAFAGRSAQSRPFSPENFLLLISQEKTRCLYASQRWRICYELTELHLWPRSWPATFSLESTSLSFWHTATHSMRVEDPPGKDRVEVKLSSNGQLSQFNNLNLPFVILLVPRVNQSECVRNRTEQVNHVHWSQSKTIRVCTFCGQLQRTWSLVVHRLKLVSSSS